MLKKLLDIYGNHNCNNNYVCLGLGAMGLHIMIIVNSIISSFSVIGIYKEWTLIGLYSVTIYFTILLGIYLEILVVYIILKFLGIQNVKYARLKKQLMITIYIIYMILNIVLNLLFLLTSWNISNIAYLIVNFMKCYYICKVMSYIYKIDKKQKTICFLSLLIIYIFLYVINSLF